MLDESLLSFCWSARGNSYHLFQCSCIFDIHSANCVFYIIFYFYIYIFFSIPCLTLHFLYICAFLFQTMKKNYDVVITDIVLWATLWLTIGNKKNKLFVIKIGTSRSSALLTKYAHSKYPSSEVKSSYQLWYKIFKFRWYFQWNSIPSNLHQLIVFIWIPDDFNIS